MYVDNRVGALLGSALYAVKVMKETRQVVGLPIAQAKRLEAASGALSMFAHTLYDEVLKDREAQATSKRRPKPKKTAPIAVGDEVLSMEEPKAEVPEVPTPVDWR